MMLEPEVVYEDEDLLVLNKPAGLQVHAARASRAAHGVPTAPVATRETLVDWLLAHYPEVRTVGDDPELRPGIVHRLDKDTSGVMLVARSKKYFEYLKLLFQRHEVKKTYVAVVAGVPAKKEGMIDAPIGIRNGTMKRSTRSAKMAKEAVTAYRVVRAFDRDRKRYALLEVNPETGRTHQIRVHLASMGHPIAGDRLYGPKVQPAWASRLMLHARVVEFSAPAGGGRMKFEVDPPEDFS